MKIINENSLQKDNPKDFSRYTGPFDLIVIGSSAGGIDALRDILRRLPKDFKPSIAIVQHIGRDSPQNLARYFNEFSFLPVREAEDKEEMKAGSVYFAPSNYHLMVNVDRSFSLSIDEPIRFSRPAIDILFETAAVSFCDRLIGIVLTGANDDGAEGLREIKAHGGVTVVQDPKEAQCATMPMAALALEQPNLVLSLKEIGDFLIGLK